MVEVRWLDIALRRRRIMKLAGLALVLLGLAGLIWQGITYSTQETVVELGPLAVKQETKKRIHLPPVASGAALAAGVALVAIGSKR
jgi:hypothetical protein